jgi:hypothetical protein
MKEQCNECEYADVCFKPLKLIKMVSKDECQQGRKKYVRKGKLGTEAMDGN